MGRDLLDRGMPIYQDPERAARAIAALLQYYKMRDQLGKRAGGETAQEPTRCGDSAV